MRKLLTMLAPVAVLALPSPARADVRARPQRRYGREGRRAQHRAGRAGRRQGRTIRSRPTPPAPVQYFVALEKLGAGLHRHGFESPQSFMMPLMRLPVPANRESRAAHLRRFSPDPRRFPRGDGAVGRHARAWCRPVPTSASRSTSASSASTSTRTATSPPTRVRPRSWPRSPAPPAALRPTRAAGAGLPLRPRRRLLAAGLRQFPDGAGRFLAGARFPAGLRPDLPHALSRGQSCRCRTRWCRSATAQGSIFASEWRIADFVSFIHLINWQVAEPERSKAARTELLEMIRLSARGLEGDPRRDRQRPRVAARPAAERRQPAHRARGHRGAGAGLARRAADGRGPARRPQAAAAFPLRRQGHQHEEILRRAEDLRPRAVDHRPRRRALSRQRRRSSPARNGGRCRTSSARPGS